MRLNCTRVFFIMVCAGWLLTTGSAWGMDANQFYRRFVEILKEARYPELEQLVRKNRGTARQSLELIRQKFQQEEDGQRKAAYGMIVPELEELIAVTGGSRDCGMSGRIVHRAEGARIPEETLEAFRRALKLCPGNLEALVGFAESNKRQGKFDEAVAGYEKVLARKQENPVALMGLGEALYSAGLYERSVAHLEGALRVEPNSRKAKALLASSVKQIALDTDGIIPAGEIVERLRTPLEGGLMCMCPMHAKLMARIRFRSITFKTEGTELDATAQAQLAELAEALKTEALRGGRFLIEGYADPLGGREYNIELSARRAETVKRHMVQVLQVDPTLISVAGVGASRSWTTNETPAGRRANRRIEVLSLGSEQRGTVAPDQ